jgi:hypothetical protein
MELLQRKPKPRPFATNSTGRLRGTLKLGSRIGRVQVYEAIGEAREIFSNELSRAILSHLNDNSDKLQDSASFVDLSLFMMGKSLDRTKPMVMFVSDDKQARTEAFRMIKNSGIIKDYPDFGFGEMELKAEFENLRPLGSQADSASVRALVARPTSFVVPEELIEVFATNTRGWDAGRQLQVKVQTGLATKTSLAAAGGVISYKGCYLLHSVHHFLPAAGGSQRVAKRRPSLTPDASEEECEVIGLSDDEDEEDRPLTITNHGITTPVTSDSESTSGSLLASEGFECSMSSHGSCEVLCTSLPLPQCAVESLGVEVPPTNGLSTRIGRVALTSALLDSAFVFLDTSERSMSELDILQLWDMAIPIESYKEHIKTRPSDAAIKTSTPNGTIGGTLSGTPSFVRLPGSKVFQEVYTGMLNSPPLPGDSGSWVKHAVSGKLFGHIIAGSPTTGLILVVPAVKVFEEARIALSEQEVGLQRARLTPGVGFSLLQSLRSETACGIPTHQRLFRIASGFGTIRATPPPRRPSPARFVPPHVPPPPGWEQPLTAQEAREAVSNYLIFRFTKAEASDYDNDGSWQKPSWKRALRIELTGISKEEASRIVRQLNRTTIPLTDKMQSLSEAEKLQIEIALEEVQQKYDNTSFQTTLVQLDGRVREVPKEGRSEEQNRKERYRKDSGLFSSTRRRKEPAKLRDRSRATMERISLTAYFKREPRPDVDPFSLLHSRNNQEGSAQLRGAAAHLVMPPDDVFFAHLTAADARGSSPAARGDPGVYPRDRLATILQLAKELTENPHIGRYYFPPRPSSPSTAPSVCSDTFSVSDRASSTSISTVSSVSWRRYNDDMGRLGTGSSSAAQETPWSGHQALIPCRREISRLSSVGNMGIEATINRHETTASTEEAPTDSMVQPGKLEPEVPLRSWQDNQSIYREKMEDASAGARLALVSPPDCEE